MPKAQNQHAGPASATRALIRRFAQNGLGKPQPEPLLADPLRPRQEEELGESTEAERLEHLGALADVPDKRVN
jgi:hypothetical protein